MDELNEVTISYEKYASFLESESMLKAIRDYLNKKKSFDDSDANVIRNFLETRKGEWK